MAAEEDRTRLIHEIARVLRDGPVPEDARAGALTFIGWLARRMPGEAVSTAGVREMIGVSSTCVEVKRRTASGSDGRRAGKGANGRRSR